MSRSDIEFGWPYHFYSFWDNFEMMRVLLNIKLGKQLNINIDNIGNIDPKNDLLHILILGPPDSRPVQANMDAQLHYRDCVCSSQS